ncbi:hypothetical protein CAL7716_058210 [Calothrix sp. PCC 7716]|nr:hypothetical protein CAL7716_058210 [Calothrix sp. PCC 7716]
MRRPGSFVLPELKTIVKALPDMVKAAYGVFADPAITEVNYVAEGKKK